MELNLPQTVNRMKDLSDDIERLSDKEDLSPEQDIQLAESHEEFGALGHHRNGLIREERLAEVRHVMKNVPGNVYKGDGFEEDPIGEPGSAVAARNDDPWNIEDMRARSLDPGAYDDEIRARALSAVELMPGSTDARKTVSARLVETYPSIARFALATSSPEFQRAFGKWLKFGDAAAAAYTDDEQKAVVRAMSLTDTAGGFLVPFQLDPTVIITSDGSLNEIRQVAREVVATGDVWNGVSSGAISFSWDAEAAEVSDDTTTFAQPTVAIHKGQGFIPISVEALADEANVTQEIGRLLAFGKDTQDAAAFATGTGSGEPFGIVVALTDGASQIDSITTDVFAIADLYALDDALPARYRANASWLANRAIYNDVRQFDTAGGAGLWEMLPSDVPNKLLGRGVFESEDMDGSLTALADNKVLIYGDFSEFVIADRVGMTVETIQHLFHVDNNLPSGQRGILAWYRLGSDSVNDGAFRMLDVT